MQILAEITTASFLIIGLFAAGAAALAYSMKPKTKTQNTADDQPPNLSTRGSWLPRVLGERRVGCIIPWVEPNPKSKKSGGGGKGFGGGGSGTLTYYGEAIHLLCVGPGYGLHSIRSGEKEMLPAPIFAEDNPSGSVIELEDGNTFQIFWGECDQPGDTWAGSRIVWTDGTTSIPIASQWPGFMRINWLKRNLGNSKTWPLHDYVVECRNASMNETITPAPDWIPESDAGRKDQGYNPAHAIWELMTGTFPHGAGIPASSFDHPAFETLATTLADEHLPVNLLLDGGVDMSRVIEEIMKDVGFWLPQVGNELVPYLIRPTSEDEVLPVLSVSMQLEPDPEETRVHGSYMSTRPTFFIEDRTRGYRPFSIPLDNDAEARITGRPTTSNITLSNVTDPRTGYLVSNRRQVEFTSNGQSYSYKSTRETRLPEFHPGKKFIVPNVGVMVLLNKSLVDRTTQVNLEAALDQYSMGTTSYLGDWTGIGPIYVGPLPDACVMPMIIPDAFNPNPNLGPGLVVARVRANSSIVGAKIFLSNSPTGPYIELGSQLYYCAGGKTNRPMTDIEMLGNCDPGVAMGTPVECVGPTLTAWNEVDNADILDLTGNDVGYNEPEQIAAIRASTSEIEFCKIRALTPVTGGWEMTGVTRAQYGSVAIAYPVNTEVTVFELDQMTVFHSSMITSGATLYVKSVPYTSSGIVDISSITPIEITVP